MSRTALVVALIVAATLAAVAVIIGRGPGGTGGPTPTTPETIRLIETNPAEAVRLTLVADDASLPPLTARRDRTHGWVGDDGWPVVGVQRLVDWLAETPVEATDGDGAAPVDLAFEVEAKGGAVERTTISRDAIGGRVAVLTSGGGRGTIEAWDSNSLGAGLRWPRARQPLPGLTPAEIARVTIRGGGGEIELARVRGHWRVRRPIAARANTLVVERTIERIATMRIREFFDEEPAGSDPALELVVERDLRSVDSQGEVRVRTDARTITIGQPRGMASWLARIDRPGAISCALLGADPTAFSTAVRNYLATTASDASPDDIASIQLRWWDGREQTIQRDLTRWIDAATRERVEDGTVAETIMFLTREPGEPQESASDNDLRSLLRVQLSNFAGEPLDVLSVGYTADGLLGVRGQNVVWLYGQYVGPELFGLPEFENLPAAEERSTPATPAGGYPEK